MRENIKDFYGAVIGYIDKATNGDEVAHDRYGKILGSYSKSCNVTKDFYGKIIATGNIVASLVWGAESARKSSIGG